MPVLSDFTVVQFDSKPPNEGSHANPYLIGDNLNASFKIPFNTGGQAHAPGLLTLMVRRLTQGSARVAIKSPTTGNTEKDIGRISPSRAEDGELWRHEQFVIPTNLLSAADGKPNTLVIGRVSNDLPTGGQFDDFQVRDIVCFFHQEA